MGLRPRRLGSAVLSRTSFSALSLLGVWVISFAAPGSCIRLEPPFGRCHIFTSREVGRPLSDGGFFRTSERGLESAGYDGSGGTGRTLRGPIPSALLHLVLPPARFSAFLPFALLGMPGPFHPRLALGLTLGSLALVHIRMVSILAGRMGFTRGEPPKRRQGIRQPSGTGSQQATSSSPRRLMNDVFV